MSSQFNTDGMLTFPDSKHPITMNALESIECTIAFDVRDWLEDRRSAWIYGIIFGLGDGDGDEFDVIKDICKEFGWDKDDIKRMRMFHEQWEWAKRLIEQKMKE